MLACQNSGKACAMQITSESHNFTVLADTGPLSVANINQPTGVHLALTATTGYTKDV